mmetsp:Transcript_3074/g.4042  ORF Transcript_3074/g.4042 Transcript_3074/m.4042 type:complete len:271 (+) Transcript_3074:53-865(+)
MLHSPTHKRKSVKWDEHNLEENDHYFAAHPAQMRITEPKTPFASTFSECITSNDEITELVLPNPSENTVQTEANAAERVDVNTKDHRTIELTKQDNTLENMKSHPTKTPPFENQVDPLDSDFFHKSSEPVEGSPADSTWREEENQMARAAKQAILRQASALEATGGTPSSPSRAFVSSCSLPSEDQEKGIDASNTTTKSKPNDFHTPEKCLSSGANPAASAPPFPFDHCHEDERFRAMRKAVLLDEAQRFRASRSTNEGDSFDAPEKMPS